MTKSLGDYNKEQSSSSDVKNIKWTQSNPIDPNLKKKKTGKRSSISPTNNIKTTKKPKSPTKQVFKIDEVENTKKPKNTKTDKKSQKASISNSKIKQGYKRPAR